MNKGFAKVCALGTSNSVSDSVYSNLQLLSPVFHLPSSCLTCLGQCIQPSPESVPRLCNQLLHNRNRTVVIVSRQILILHTLYIISEHVCADLFIRLARPNQRAIFRCADIRTAAFDTIGEQVVGPGRGLGVLVFQVSATDFVGNVSVPNAVKGGMFLAEEHRNSVAPAQLSFGVQGLMDIADKMDEKAQSGGLLRRREIGVVDPRRLVKGIRTGPKAEGCVLE